MGARELAGYPSWVITLGEGPRQVLALHCTLGRSEMWAPLVPGLGPDVTLTAFDLPGYGQSAPWTGERAAGRDVHDVGTAMGLDVLRTGMDVIGHSYGATIALRMALEAPEKVRSLVLIEPVLMSVARADAPELLDANQILSAPFFEAVEAEDWPAAARAFTEIWGSGRPWAANSARAQAAMAEQIRIVPQTEPTLYDDRPGILDPGRLQGLRIPTLLVAGDESFPIMKAVVDGLARRLPQARQLAVPGAGHMLPITHTEALAQATRDFWQSLPR